jgi:DNA polymerase I-like protein with 3'-5' exonuclease and polymerase domains
MAINTVIQGSAADFVKFALIKIMERIEGLDPILQVHDEWVFEGLWTEDLRERLRQAADVAGDMGISVPIPCKISVGPNYGELA